MFPKSIEEDNELSKRPVTFHSSKRQLSTVKSKLELGL